jgi:hypothetical protein
MLDGLFNLGGKVIDRIWPSADKKLEADAARQAQQAAITQEQAKSSNFFIAGPRAFIMWIGALAIGYTFLFVPILQYVAKVAGWPQPDLPVLDARLFQLLLAMLGLA